MYVFHISLFAFEQYRMFEFNPSYQHSAAQPIPARYEYINDIFLTVFRGSMKRKHADRTRFAAAGSEHHTTKAAATRYVVIELISP